jgi:hypothetical protein
MRKGPVGGALLEMGWSRTEAAQFEVLASFRGKSLLSV